MSKCSYGLPYSGSKNFIAKQIIDLISPCDHFYDLFGGGGAITHYALLSGKFKYVHYNEVNSLIADTFIKAIDGYYLNENRWINREDFFRLKNTDGYVALCFSFSIDMKSYCYSKELEPLKHKEHFNRLYTGIKTTRLQHLERLDRINNLTCLSEFKKQGRLIITDKDYRDVAIQDNSVIYCDPPYADTKGYSRKGKKFNDFDSKAFLDWASKQKNIFISEMQADERFECIWEKQKRVLTDCNQKHLYRTEKVFTVKQGISDD